MKKLILSLFLCTIIFTSCYDEYYYNGVIRQNIINTDTQFIKHKGYVLKTVVYYDSILILSYEDKINIDNTNDIEILKRKRYSEAITLIDKIRAIDDIKVSKK